MRIDVVTIFPEYLAPLSLSLPGKAQDRGLLDVHVHDLRGWTHDRHRTVDDTPYGGGAGMVMKPEPWGEALDEVLADDAVLVVPTPSGEPFTQAVARELAGEGHLVFACGRYEGIDHRVVEHARQRARVRELSIGDYVLNGGEVAALAITEAVVRLLPGFMGNPESLVEESHESGLLEYPVYTKPAGWRGLEVPPVLLSGDHAAIAAWRHDQAVRRTVERRPDLAHAARALDVGDLTGAVEPLRPADLGELQTLQWACFEPALRETPDELAHDLAGATAFVLRSGGRIVGSVAGRPEGDEWRIFLLMVAPDLRGRGLGRWLLEHAEAAAPDTTTAYVLSTAAGSDIAERWYRRAGYRRRGEPSEGLLRLAKPARRARRS
ncbi:tRNA (guanosine(37)-N1)-methyltransferase TrmD [Nocardioides sp. GCM10027113]|uniref:tRNA (guanosine(37)-N1)-methyltransferase TrmD n=1 Tax=unclassified Nocardioides TaxID=2615069 RepID=UPI0036080818